MPRLNLDTYILIYMLSGSFKAVEQSLLMCHRWSVSAIVLWEIAKLVQIGHIDLDLGASSDSLFEPSACMTTGSGGSPNFDPT